MNSEINLIVAFDTFNGIAKNNQIPWSIKEDINFFQDTTTRKYISDKLNVIIMGKNTWKSLPVTSKGLKNRITIIISTTLDQDELDKENINKTEIYLVKSLEEALSLCQRIEPGKIFICGGHTIYKSALEKKIIDEIYLTNIEGNYNCDVFFPAELLSKTSSFHPI